MSKREDILTATRDILVEEGIQAISFPKIFKKANVGSGTVYNYFANKENLLNTLYLETRKSFDSFIMKDFDDHLPLKERFFSIGLHFIRYVSNHPQDLQVLLTCNHSPVISLELRKKPNEAMMKTLNLLEEGMGNKTLKKMEPLIAYHMFTGALLSIAQGANNHRYILSDGTIRTIIEVLWDSLLEREIPSAPKAST